MLFGICLTGNKPVVKAIEKQIDVYLIAGQSNAAGFSTNNRSLLLNLDERYVNGFSDVLYYGRVGNEKLYNLVNVKSGLGSNERIGPELGMASVLSDHYQGRKTTLIKFAVGGAYLADEPNHNVSVSHGTWSSPTMIAENGGKKFTKSGLIYENFLKTVNDGFFALKAQGYTPIIKGIAWMQGCQDAWSSTHVYKYAENLSMFISDLRSDLGKIMNADLSKLPFAIGKINSKYNASYVNEVRKQQDIVLGSVKYTYEVETSELALPGTDNAHFNTADMVELGKLFANALLTVNNSNFVKINSLSGGNGIGGGWKVPGDTCKLIVIADKGYGFSKAIMTINGKEVDITNDFIGNQYQYIMPKEDVEFTLLYIRLPVYNININLGNGGNIYRTISTRNPYQGEEITFTVMASKGYELASFIINGEEVELTENNTHTLVVNQDLDVEAKFTLISSSEDNSDGNNNEPIIEETGCKSNQIVLPFTLYTIGMLFFAFFRRIKLK